MSSESRKIFSLSIFSPCALESPLYKSRVFLVMLFVAILMCSAIPVCLVFKKKELRQCLIPWDSRWTPHHSTKTPSPERLGAFIRLFLSFQFGILVAQLAIEWSLYFS